MAPAELPNFPPLVSCDRRAMRLLEASCVRSFRASQAERPPVWQGNSVCYQCPLGAARAGEVIDQLQIVRNSLGKVCTRCARMTDRIIANRFCVSCYNRNREIAIGRNAKGAPPRFVAARLAPCHLVVVAGGTVEYIDAPRAAGVMELILNRARRAKMPVAFGWAPGRAVAA